VTNFTDRMLNRVDKRARRTHPLLVADVGMFFFLHDSQTKFLPLFSFPHLHFHLGSCFDSPPFLVVGEWGLAEEDEEEDEEDEGDEGEGEEGKR